MTDAELTDRLRRLAAELGFTAVGVAPAVTPPGAARLDEWLSAGYAGEMSYLADRREAYEHPRHVLEGARSVLMLALDYQTDPPRPAPPGHGRVARYAWGDADYHDLIRPRLHRLADSLREWRPGATARGVVDTAPLMERDFAVMAGLGWIGKNTLLLSKSRGSYFFLAALVTDAQLAIDTPHATDHCGTCTACLDACPTDAFPAPGVLDASRCISYLTIEARALPPTELRDGVGQWLFGCDVCQEVCPWNRHAKRSGEAGLEPRAGMDPVDLAPLFELDDAAFRARFRHTPLWRAKRRGLLRNAAFVLGATGAPHAERPLGMGLRDTEPLVRSACAWALGRIATPAARRLLRERLAVESDAATLAELHAACA
ncbi:tRNA epoxyqueuosine(34) reductase QueG [Botrimarina sp.]|uniref:tRNA epoxyqueuosine(34) reductase QueG n=1 Tax=Botrimarina sp. TaxID=2795802 RepID=UPI0032EF884B